MIAHRLSHVVVVGAGIIGACTAYYLRRRGVEVTVVEKSFTGEGATGLSAGAFRSQFPHAEETALTLRSQRLWQEFEAEHSVSLDYRPVGFVMLASNETVRADLDSRARFQADLGLEIHDLSPTSLAARYPGLNTADVVRATYTPHDGYSTPTDVTNRIMTVARDLGVRLLHHTAVVALKSSGESINEVITSNGETIRCDAVVNAAGLDAATVGALAGVSIPLRAYRMHQFITEPIQGFDTTEIPNLMDPSLGLYLRGEGNRLLLSISREAEAWREDYTPDWTLLEDLGARLTHRWPTLTEYGISHGYVGCYPRTPDDRAVMGWCGGPQGFIQAVGFSGHGFMHGLAAGEATADYVLTGQWTGIDLTAFRYPRSTTVAAPEGVTEVSGQ